ncbi:alpha-tocopherol transfer protein-like [Tropilaelaps mercedesae]|uniref:Alpha-tocopherol transfer protein-like n=1 Tax=Tropilaelaps mercedesae TaxID=418985 RepID=A0A1V9XU89_9ACAR|nr:alpha-tocopherol transfer protein-like [Tropilaelaps mercedesae]
MFPQVTDWQKRASHELGETPELRRKLLDEFRSTVAGIKEFRPRLDDEFLLRFLRAKKFNLQRAVRTYKRYFRIRLVDPERFMPVGKGPKDYAGAFELEVGALLEQLNPLDGTTTIIWRVGKWSPSCGLDLRDIVTPTAMVGDLSLEDPQVQVNGVRFIIDLEKMQYSYLRYIPFSAIKALVMALQDGYPARFKGVHVVHNTSLWDFIYSAARPLLAPKQRARFHLHGNDLSSLHRFIPAEILPSEYGGTAGHFSGGWILKKLYENHEKFVRNSYYGYNVPCTQENCRSG